MNRVVAAKKVAFARVLELACPALRHPAALGRLEQAAARDVVLAQLFDVVGAGPLDETRTYHAQALGLATGIHHDGRGGVGADVAGGELAEYGRLGQNVGHEAVANAFAVALVRDPTPGGVVGEGDGAGAVLDLGRAAVLRVIEVLHVA